MDTSNYTHDDDSVENGLERTDGGYGHASNGVGNPVTQRLRSIGIPSKSTVSDQRVSFDNEGDVPAIVKWHEMLRQGR